MPKNEVQRVKDRLAVSHKKFEKEMEGKIKRWREYYRSIQWPATDPAQNPEYTDKTVDNMVFSNIKAIMPSINFNNPRIYVQAKKKPFRTKGGLFDTIAASVIVEILANYYYQELEIKRQVDKCLFDALLGPWGIMQLGYTLKTEKIKGDKLLEANELIKEDSPFVIRRSPMDFRVDITGKDSHLEDAEWIGFKWVKTLEDVKSTPTYKHTDKLKPNILIEKDFVKAVSVVDERGLEESEDWNRVEGWDIWNRKQDTLFTVVEGHDKFLQERNWPLEYDGWPAETLYFNENPDELFPLGDVEVYEKAQDELNRMRSLQLSHVKRVSQRKYIDRDGAFTLEEKRKITHGGDGTIATSKMALENAIIPLKDATTSQDLYIALKSLKDNIRKDSGVAQFEEGTAQKFDTATEPALIAQGLTIRRAERTAILEDFVVHVVRKLGKILQQTLETTSVPLSTEQFELAQEFSKNKLDKIAGPENATILQPWLNTSKEDIKGDYLFRIDVGSMQPINQEKRKADIVAVSQLLKDSPYINTHEGNKRVLEAFEIKEIEKLLKTPEQVAKDRQETMKTALQTELAKDKPKRDTDLQKTQMKTETQREKTKTDAAVSLLTAGLRKGTGGSA